MRISFKGNDLYISYIKGSYDNQITLDFQRISTANKIKDKCGINRRNIYKKRNLKV